MNCRTNPEAPCLNKKRKRERKVNKEKNDNHFQNMSLIKFKTSYTKKMYKLQLCITHRNNNREINQLDWKIVANAYLKRKQQEKRDTDQV